MQPQTPQQNQQPNTLATPPSTPVQVPAPTPPVPQPPIAPTPPLNTQVVQPPSSSKLLLKEKLPEWLFFYGFASIFLINFVNAIVDPKAFTTLLTSNAFVPSFLPSAKLLVDVAAVNDLALGVLILTKWKKKWVYAWAGAWLLIVAITKAGHFLA